MTEPEDSERKEKGVQIPPRPQEQIPDLLADKTPKIIFVLIKLKKRRYRNSTIEGIDKALRQIGKRCNLDNPDSVIKTFQTP